jgi:membrane associated rhomboid family serine protease
MFPLRDENPVDRLPILTWLIIGACIVAYFFWQPSPLGDDAEDTEFLFRQAAIPCEVVQNRPLDGAEVQATLQGGDQSACDIDEGRSAAAVPDKEPWVSVVVSMFLHGSILHIAGNLLFLWVFGNNVEDVFGKVGFTVFYLVGGGVATLAHVYSDVDSTVPLVGASGAIAAVMGAYAVLFPGARVKTLLFFLFFLVIDLPALLLLVAWFVLQFFTDPNAGVAWTAHVGGFVFGALVALVYRAVRGAPRPGGRRIDAYSGSYNRRAWG